MEYIKEETNKESIFLIKNIKINDLHDFEGHPFKVENDKELFKLMQSIEKEGVLVPLIARPRKDGKGLEVVSGHRRKEASKWAGLDEVPVVIKELDDNQAVIAMVDSNLHRENIKPSEKAFAYKMKLEAIKGQGRRNDLIKEEERLGANETLAKEFGQSKAQISRYIRLTYLIAEILEMVDQAQIGFRTGVEISFLKEEEQYFLLEIMEREEVAPSLSQAQRIKKLSKEGKLNQDIMLEIMEEEKPNQKEQIKIKAETLEGYFPKDYTPAQKVIVIEKLVKAWHINRTKQKEINKKEKIK